MSGSLLDAAGCLDAEYAHQIWAEEAANAATESEKTTKSTPTKSTVTKTSTKKSKRDEITPPYPLKLEVMNRCITTLNNLQGISKLRILNISHNPIRSLNGIEQLLHLQELYAYNCSLETLEGIEKSCYLEILYVHHNRLKTIDSTTFSLLKQLTKLRLDSNELTTIEKSAFQHCTSMTDLNLSQNKLQNFSFLIGLQSLKTLAIHMNRAVNSLSSYLIGLPNLIELNASSVGLVNMNGIQNCRQLQILYLENNLLTSLDIPPYHQEKAALIKNKKPSSGTVTYSTAMKKTKGKPLTNTTTNTNSSSASSSITALPDLDRPQLSEIYVSGNKIRDVNGLEQLSHSLEILDLRGNEIRDLQSLGTAIGSQLQLTELYLQRNPALSSLETRGGPATVQQEIANLKLCLYESCPLLEEANGVITEDPKDGAVFHTWDEDGGEEEDVAATSEPVYTMPVPLVELRGIPKWQGDEEEIDEEELAEAEADAAYEAEFEERTRKYMVPKMKAVMSEEKLKNIENKFTDLLRRVKTILIASETSIEESLNVVEAGKLDEETRRKQKEEEEMQRALAPKEESEFRTQLRVKREMEEALALQAEAAAAIDAELAERVVSARERLAQSQPALITSEITQEETRELARETAALRIKAPSVAHPDSEALSARTVDSQDDYSIMTGAQSMSSVRSRIKEKILGNRIASISSGATRHGIKTKPTAAAITVSAIGADLRLQGAGGTGADFSSVRVTKTNHRAFDWTADDDDGLQTPVVAVSHSKTPPPAPSPALSRQDPYNSLGGNSLTEDSLAISVQDSENSSIFQYKPRSIGYDPRSSIHSDFADFISEPSMSPLVTPRLEDIRTQSFPRVGSAPSIRTPIQPFSVGRNAPREAFMSTPSTNTPSLRVNPNASRNAGNTELERRILALSSSLRD